ncbi:hypothetical protein BH11ARM2_BH11ARM2_24800 [soil metagenome]
MRKLLFVLAAAVAASASAQVRLIARLAPGADPVAVATAHKIDFLDRTTDGPFALFSATDGADGERAQAEMGTDTRVIWVEDDDVVASPEGAGDPPTVTKKGSVLPVVGDRKALYPFNKSAFDVVGWSETLAGAVGRTVRVGILDTGLGQKQTAMWAKVDASVNFVEKGRPAYDHPRNIDSDGDGVKDSATGHGTFVAGIIDQLAPQTRLVIARVADSDGLASAWTLIKGLSFAVAQKCEVVNVSLGTQSDLPAMDDVLDYCEEQGTLVVAAMGNDNTKRADYPARCEKAVAVAGLLPDLVRAPFSNWENACDASAPATGILSQWWDGKTAIWSGTSFSTPIVAALLADAARRSPVPVKPATFRKLLPKCGTRPDKQNPQAAGKLGVVPDHARLVKAVGG